VAIVNKYRVKNFPSVIYLSKKAKGELYADPYHYKSKWEYKHIRLPALRFATKLEERKETTTKNEDSEKKENPKLKEALEEEEKAIINKRDYTELTGSNYEELYRDTMFDNLIIHGYNPKEGKHYEHEIIYRKLYGLAIIVDFDVTKEENKGLWETEFKNNKTPFIAMYSRGGIKYRTKAIKIYGKQDTLSTFAGFLYEFIPDSTKPLTQEDMSKFTTESLMKYKAAVILFQNSPKTLLTYRAIAA